jgi:hypothetical protein
MEAIPEELRAFYRGALIFVNPSGILLLIRGC